MLYHIYKMLNKYNIIDDINQIIIDNIFKYKWKFIISKIKIRINALDFKVINILSIDNLKPPKNILRKTFFLQNAKPLLPLYINVIDMKDEYYVNYKIKIIEKNYNSSKYITYYNNGAVIWDNSKPRHSIMFKPWN